jgi:biotin carboxylase
VKKKTTVWLNTHLNCVAPIRQADTAGEFRLVTSYRSQKYQADALLADLFELEPTLEDVDYVDYALDFVARHGVDIFFPGRKMEAIAHRRAEFEARGVKLVLAGDAETLDILRNKGRFYDALAGDSVPVPRYAVARTAEEFGAAIDALQGEMPIVCFKPTVGIFGRGFQVVRTDANAHRLSDLPKELVTDRDAALGALSTGDSFRPQIVLAYLPGEERSVDCLADRGRLVRAVVRYKLPDGSRVLERNDAVEAHARRLTERFGLSGVFNAQFKDHEGTPYVLEINARMSGGIGMSCLSGVALPYWALRIAMGTCTDADIPLPKTGLRVAEVTQSIVLGEVG